MTGPAGHGRAAWWLVVPAGVIGASCATAGAWSVLWFAVAAGVSLVSLVVHRSTVRAVRVEAAALASQATTRALAARDEQWRAALAAAAWPPRPPARVHVTVMDEQGARAPR